MEDKNIVEFELLEHQAGAVNKINGEYSIAASTGKVEKSEGIYDEHNVAGAVEPTGTGKSYIALAQMIVVNNDNYKGITKSIDEKGYERYHINIQKNPDGSVNRSKIVYVAPTNEIAAQIKIDIVKDIANIDPDNLSSAERDKIVYELFPNLSFKCYATLANGARNHDEDVKGGYDPYEDNPDLVILDEVHRSGAATWQKGTAALLGCKVEDGKVIQDENAAQEKKNIKVLSISATPERDVDGIDMTKVWASAIGGYTEKELSDDVRADLGIKMTLPEAINKGILRNPDVVYFDCNLGETDDYCYLVRIANNQDIDVRIRDEAKTAIEEINNKVIGIPNYDKLNQEQREKAREEKEIEILTQSIIDGKFNIHGKFILFAPKNTAKNNPNGEKDFLKYHAEKTTRIIDEALKRAGIENTIDVKYISSEQSDTENDSVLSKFNSKDVTKGPIQIVVAQEKFNEGVHAKNISGGFNTRSIMEQENTQLRAQSILFLQQKGRFDAALIPGKTPPPKPTIFDRCNNFYTQNINGAIDAEQRIPILELTETQKILHNAYVSVMTKVPEKANIADRLPKLISISHILNKYNIPMDSKNINEKCTLLKLLEKPEYAKDKEYILKELEEQCLIAKKRDGKYADYKLGKTLKDARDRFWKGVKAFENYSCQELLNAGIIERSDAGNKGYISEEGFIIMGPTSKFFNYNIETGTLYNKEGKDIDGFYEGQFDQETGLDADGYDRRGFNKDGIHKDTKTIHDIHGFKADGINILTGTDEDLGGYTRDGIKRFKNKAEKVVGGFDRNHNFHPLDPETGVFSKNPTGKYAPYEEKVNVDEYGFIAGSHNNNNAYTDGTPYSLNGFYKKNKTPPFKYYIFKYGNSESPTNREGYYITGYDKNGFNKEGVHSATGTRYDPDGYTKEELNIESVRNTRALLKILEDNFETKEFASGGISRSTGTHLDQYGFSMYDYSGINKAEATNRFGFKIDEIPRVSKNNYKTFKYKNREYSVNIYGCTENGINILTNQRDASLDIFEVFIQNCIEGDSTPEKYIRDYAIKNKMLEREARAIIQGSVGRAIGIYRESPVVAKNDKYANKMMRIAKQPSTKIQETLFNMDPNIKELLANDVEELRKEIASLESIDKDELKKQEEALSKIILKDEGR